VIDVALPLVARWRREHKELLLCIIGNCYKHLGEYDKAEQYIRRSLAEKPQPWAWVYLHSRFIN
jgi:tetratricopeptide (TPR) repeat protein